MNPFAGNREDHLTEREEGIAAARAALRAEREQLAADRAEVDRLLADAQSVNRQARHFRARAKRLARRFVRRVRHQQETAVHQLAEQAAKLSSERELFANQTAAVEKARSAFHVAAAADRDRLRHAWVLVREQQKRAATDWGETTRYLAEETNRLVERAAEAARQEKELADARARIEAETAGFREESAALEARIENVRASLAELEHRRDLVRAELLGIDLPIDLQLVECGDGIAGSEQELAREELAVAALKESLDREASELNDRRRVAAEQLAMLAEARAEWQRAEQATVAEMEHLARDLGSRELVLNLREQRLIRADRRRRDSAFELWHLRLHLEAWQTKLTAFEMHWHTQRQQLEEEYRRRVSLLTRREVELETTVELWEKARSGERERLRAELELWADDRVRLSSATADFDRRRHEMLDELGRLAARAMAAEELMAWVLRDKGAERERRRLAVLRRWWDWRFARQVREIDHRRVEASVERAVLDDRYLALQELLVQAAEREAAGNHRLATALDLNGAVLRQLTTAAGSPPSAAPETVELVALRDEVERLATLFVEMELPNPAEEVPWAVDATNEAEGEGLSFDPSARAA